MKNDALPPFAGFWRRIAAGWIDAFLLFIITTFLVEILALLHFRISFGTVFVIAGAAYSSLMLLRFGQTPGKRIMKVILLEKSGEPLSRRSVLLREMFGKWGVCLALPMMFALILGGRTYLSTFTDLLYLIPPAVFCLAWYLFTRQMWYDRMAGVTLEYHPKQGKSKLALMVLVAAALAGGALAVTQYRVMHRIPCRLALYRNSDPVKPYVRFLKHQGTSPVDYVIGLFDRYDVVVLCERAHPEMTQYDFIYDIIRDPRFIDKAGMVFTEIGQKGNQSYMDAFMNNDSLTDPQVREQILHITRNEAVHPAWSNYNWYRYIERLYRLNRTLPPEKRVRHYFTDAAVDWYSIKNHADYQAYCEKSVWHRDSLMAQTVIDIMSRPDTAEHRHKKCLVIMNYRHAFDLTDGDPRVDKGNTFEYIRAAFGNRAANVMINTRVITLYPPASGLWEEAFEATGNKPLGFNFRGSPFGADHFDLFPWDISLRRMLGVHSPSADGLLRYRDVFTGFVFVNPSVEFYWQQNTPGYYDGFESEYIRRCACVGSEYEEGARQEMAALKASGDLPPDRFTEFRAETLLSLFLYAFFGIGFVIGLMASGFQKA